MELNSEMLKNSVLNSIENAYKKKRDAIYWLNFARGECNIIFLLSFALENKDLQNKMTKIYSELESKISKAREDLNV